MNNLTTKFVKRCKNEGCENEFTPFKTTEKYCSWECKKANMKPDLKLKSPKPISKVSKKQKVLNAKYSVLRIQYLGRPENKTCFIEGCNKKADTIEHRKGRKGFADDWARENNIPLIIDERFFSPCCLAHNLELENNPELSKQYQLSKIHNGNK